LAYLARLRTTATNDAIAAVLGLARGECVPNLTRRFETLILEPRGRRRLKLLERQLGEASDAEKAFN
jgi:hypothetical protein